MALLLTPLTPVFDTSGALAVNALVQVYRAGTTTAAPIYYDAEFNTPAPNPIPTRGGKVPPIYVSGGLSYRVRTLRGPGPDSLVLDDFDDLTIPGAASGGGGDDGTAVGFETGAFMHRYGDGPVEGWVRANGRTIGSAVSSAIERSRDDCFALFVFLWNVDPNLAVAGGRGTNAEADWSAGKTIALPDLRGRTLVGLDGMGAGAAGRLTGTTFGFGSATTLGSYGGAASAALALANLPAHSHSATGTAASAGAHQHTGNTDPGGNHGHTLSIAAGGEHSHSGTTGSAGSHNHAGSSTANDGGHTHSATTGAAGGHSHDIAYRQVTSGYDAGTNAGAVQSVGSAGANTSGTTDTVAPHSHSVSVSSAGVHNHAVTIANEPAHTHNFVIGSSGQHTHTGTADTVAAHLHAFTTASAGGHTHPLTISVANAGSGSPFSAMPPFVLVSIYIRL